MFIKERVCDLDVQILIFSFAVNSKYIFSITIFFLSSSAMLNKFWFKLAKNPSFSPILKMDTLLPGHFQI